MSTPDTQHMIRVVAEKFLRWKPVNCVTGATYKGLIASCGCGATNVQGPHEIPPPDLLQPDGAWALLVALHKKGIEVEFDPAQASGGAPDVVVGGHFAIVRDGLPLALLTAAFQLTEEGRK